MRRSQLPSQTPPKPAVLMDDDDDDAEAQPARAAPAAAAPAGATPSAGQRRTRSEAKTSPAVQRSVDGAAAGHAAGATPVAAELSPPAAVAKPARALKYDPATEAEKLLSLCQKHSFLTAFDKTGQPNPDLFKSFRKDLVHMYTAFAFCNSCAESGRHNHNCWFVRADTLAVHIAHKHREVTSPTVANADVLRGSIRMTLALWAASAGVAEVHVRRFGELLGSRLSTTPLPISQRAIVSYDRLVADAADVSDSCAKRSLREQSFVAVSFDGGRWQHKGQYLLVTVAHSPAGMFVLRPQTSETPYDGKSIAECFTTTLHAVGAPILHAMVDGCTANFAALKGVEILAQELAAVDLDSDEDEAAGEGEADNADPRKNVLEKLAEALHDVNMLDIASRYPKRLLCIAHWLKNRVLDIQKTLKSDAMTAVSLLTKALFSNDGPSVRRGQLRRFIREKRIALTRQSTGALVALADDLTLLLAAMRSEDTEGAVETFATLKTSLLKEIVCVQGGDITATTIQALKFDDVGAIDTLTTIKERLVAAAASTKITPRAVRIATTNQTRWHSSVYASYVFLAEYLHYVKEFFDLPARQTSDSAKKLHELLSVPETFDAILVELGRYTSSLEPMADLLTLISDVSAARPMAHRMHSQFEQMRKKLADQPEGTPGRLLAAELFDAKVIGEEKIAATLETFWYVKLFVPGSLVGRGQAYKTRFNAHKLRASHVRLVFGFTDSEFPECEWELWNEHRENVRDSAYTETPMLYWASDEAKMRFPTLHKAALYVLSLPVAVTSCDSVISVMGAAFSTRQNALSTDKSSALLAFRCNGDTEKKTLDPSAFPRWGDRIATTTTTTTA